MPVLVTLLINEPGFEVEVLPTIPATYPLAVTFPVFRHCLKLNFIFKEEELLAIPPIPPASVPEADTDPLFTQYSTTTLLADSEIEEYLVIPKMPPTQSAPLTEAVFRQSFNSVVPSVKPTIPPVYFKPVTAPEFSFWS